MMINVPTKKTRLSSRRNKLNRCTSVQELLKTFASSHSPKQIQLALKDSAHLKKQFELHDTIVADISINGNTSLEWDQLGSVTTLLHCRKTIGRSSSGQLVLDIKAYNRISVSSKSGDVLDARETLHKLVSTIKRAGCCVIIGAGASNKVKSHTSNHAKVFRARAPGETYSDLLVYSKKYDIEQLKFLNAIKLGALHPLSTHKLLGYLASKGYLKRLYTQNIDGLELLEESLSLAIVHKQRKSCTVSGNVVQLHGHMRMLYCPKGHSKEYTNEDAAHIAVENRHIVCDDCRRVPSGLQNPIVPTMEEAKDLSCSSLSRIYRWIENVNAGINEVCISCIISLKAEWESNAQRERLGVNGTASCIVRRPRESIQRGDKYNNRTRY